MSRSLLALVALGILGVLWSGGSGRLAAEGDEKGLREQSHKLMREGNFKEALEGFRKLCHDGDTVDDDPG